MVRRLENLWKEEVVGVGGGFSELVKVGKRGEE